MLIENLKVTCDIDKHTILANWKDYALTEFSKNLKFDRRIVFSIGFLDHHEV